MSQKTCSMNILTKFHVNLVSTAGYYLPLQVLDIKNSTDFFVDWPTTEATAKDHRHR